MSTPRPAPGSGASSVGGTLLCEPNVSEGRDPERMDRLAASVSATDGVRLIHRSADRDHNRMVLAYLGAPAAVVEATRRLAARAFEEIDLGTHRGVHPRLGALDVVPFVPLAGLSMDAALAACRSFGAWVGDRGVPVFYYEMAATRPERRALPAVRAGGFEGLAARMSDPDWAPDEGPPRPHPGAGAVITGVRTPLVRFNVNLATDDPRHAHAIASGVREASGGLAGVRALGFALENRGLTQVSMNITDYRSTSIAAAYERVLAAARARGIGVAGTEIIGPVPRAALTGLDAEILARLEEEQTLEMEEER